ncbi:Low affinity Fe/Cu permease [Prosthecobacter debontii]|uniref:Low affinity Fe/Cu permease n=1 Tax=Prosthecobacter debontii TaxID=48467 RepID=A0A1T4WXL3_9BACT|nr:low affinity iron permease family protein [Prosthecobacter debontii]SKA82102.1 Low affinity Fe/Cu permease [Prosthecobacter debontii]
MKDLFAKMASQAARGLGHPFAFILALLIVLGWAALGPSLGYSETWQLVINTGTTIVTFLSVFLIQNSQNRESMAMQLKLDEIIRSIKAARDDIIDLEDLPEEQLEKLAEEFRQKVQRTKSQPSKKP